MQKLREKVQQNILDQGQMSPSFIYQIIFNYLLNALITKIYFSRFLFVVIFLNFL